jgi:hypothetical protein
MTNGVVELNFDKAGNSEFRYGNSSSFMGSMPDIWQVGFALQPVGSSKLLRSNPQSVVLPPGDRIDSSLAEYQKSGHFGLQLLHYQSVTFDGGATWQYQTLTPAFEKETEVLLGLKLALPIGTHYGWLKLARPVVDLHTPFEIKGYAYHPVPGEAIGAGEPPPPPPLQSAVVAEDGTLNFSWDPAWGAVLLEWTDNLAAPDWQPVPDGTVPPVTQLPGDGQRFYRLRRP